MIEMSVRSVKRADGDRLVAVLERSPEACRPAGRLLVTVTRAEAHVLYHELRAERTLLGQTYELMAEIVSELKGKLTAIELIAGGASRPPDSGWSARMGARRCRHGRARRWPWRST